VQDQVTVDRILGEELPPDEYYCELAEVLRRKFPLADPTLIDHAVPLVAACDTATSFALSFGIAKFQLAQAQVLWAALGAQVRTMSALDHDSAFAAVSHLPHMLAFAAMNAINAQDQGAQYLSLAGPGFRDFTRIAASDPKVWRDILVANREELLAQSKIFQQSLHSLENLMANNDGDSLERLIEQASDTRASWRISSQNPHK
jgi:hypothetical protein